MKSRADRLQRVLTPLAFLLILSLSFTDADAQTHFTNCVSNTGNNASLFVSTAINPSVNGRFLKNGDEIAVFTPEGLCAGVKVWDGTNTAITVWGDDSITSGKDGFAGGDTLRIHIWEKSVDVEWREINADFDVKYDAAAPFRADARYQSDALYSVTRLLVAEKDENRPPVASFTAIPASSADPFRMSFDASASVDIDGTVRNYLWNFGDGSTASGPTVSHTYVSAGSYTVSLTVTDDDGAVGAATALITISEPAPPENITPSASFTASPAPDGNGLKVNLDASASSDPDGSVTAYRWAFGDGTNGTGRTASHTYSEGGTYSIGLTVDDNEGASGSATASITLTDPAVPTNQRPVASFTAVPTADWEFEFDASNSVDTDGSVVGFSWDFGDEKAGSGQIVRHVFDAAGTYNVRLTVTDNEGATGTATATINVTAPPTSENRLPSASFSATQLSGATDPYTVRFDASPSYDPDGTIASYQWTFGDGASATGVTTTHVYPGAGSYSVRLKVTDNEGGIAESTVTIELTAPDPPANQAPSASFTAAPGVADFSIDFDASASRDNDGQIASYRWNFGDGSTGSGRTPNHVYASAGDYAVALTVTDDDGSVGAATATVRVRAPEAPPSQPPAASFTASQVASGVYEMRFDASASTDPDGSITSYAWNFGDGATATGAVTTHSYASSGSYTVTLTVTDNDGNTNRATVTVELTEPSPPANQAPSASFTAAPGDNALQIVFDGTGSADSDGSIVSYAWNFGDGTTGTGTSPTHAYAAAGSYTVSLTVTDDDGSKGTASATLRLVEANPPSLPPAASFTAAQVASASEPFTVRVDAGASYDPDGSIVSYEWDFGDGTTGTGSLALHSYPAAGSYTVTLTVTDNAGNTGRASADIELTDESTDPNLPPAASFTAFAGEENYEAVFDASSSSDTDGQIIAYRWSFGDGSGGTGQVVNHIYSGPGTYIVTLTVVDNDGSVGTSTASVKVNKTKARNNPPNVTLTARETSSEEELSVMFDGSGSTDSDGSVVSHDWDFGDGERASGASVRHVFTRAGTYTVTLTVSDDEGASSIASILMELVDPDAPANQPPSANFSAVQNASRGDFVMEFDASASSDPDGSVSTHVWDFGDGARANGERVTHDYGAAGTYSVTLTVTDDRGTFGTSSSSITLTQPRTVANVPPSASFSALPTQDGPFTMSFDASSSVDADGEITGFSWDFGDGTNAVGPTVTHRFPNAGNYTVRLFVTDDQDNVGSATASVTLLDPKKNSVPTASFTFAPLREVSPVAVTLDASGSFDIDGAIGQFLWDFGDGKGGSGKQVTHEYDGSGTYVVSLTITDNTGASAKAADTISVRFDLPDHLDLVRIGQRAVRGSAEYQGDVLLIESEGHLGTNEDDEFHFVFSPMSKDGEIVARVVSMETEEDWAAVGVMVRERLTPSSRFVSMMMTNEFGGSFQQRSAPATAGVRQTPGIGWLPYWVRLVRKDDLFTGYVSIDGERWKVIGETRMDMAADVYVGVAAASNADSVLTVASVDQIVIESSEPDVVEIPTEYELSDVYPNPFNPEARFTLTVSQEEQVKIELFDAIGRLVRTISNDVLSANTVHQIVISADRLPSGLYIVRASGDEFVAIRKAILLK